MSTAGQLGGGLVGGIAGALLGGPTGALYGAQAGLAIGGYLDPAPGPTTEGPRLSDRSVQTSTYGAVIPRIYGTAPVAGNLIWLQGNQLTETITKTKKGGKGGGSKTTTVTYSYSATCAFALADTRALGAPFVGVRRIWTSQGLFYDAGSSDPDTIQASNDAAEGFTFYPGSDTQLPDPSIQADIGAANTPAYRGLAYIVFADLPLAAYGNSLAGLQLRVELFASGTYQRYPVTPITLPTVANWAMTVWTGSVFVRFAHFNTNAYVSPDGVTWTAYPCAFGSPFWSGVAYGNGVIVASSFQATQPVFVSVDHGQTWAAYYPGDINSGPLAYGAGLFVMSDSSKVATSVNGVTWTLVSLPENSSGNGSRILWNGAQFLVWMNAISKAMTSATGNSGWSSYSLALNNHNFGTVKGGVFYLGSNGGFPAISSSDGLSWTTRAIMAQTQALTSDNDHYVCFGNDRFSYSANGDTWTTIIGTLPVNAAWQAPCFNGAVISAATGVSVTGANIIPYIVSPALTNLAAIVLSECLQSGLLTSGDIDVAALTSDVRGYRIGNIGTIRAALEPLRAAWPFDVVQDGYGIRFTPRGGASVVTIPAADLDARPAGESPGVQITTAREMDSQLPRRIEINFLDVDREYDAGLQYDERLNTAATNLETIDLPIVLTATEAAGKAQVLLYQRWLDRYTVGPIRLPSAYASLQPADVVSLTTAEGLVDLRITGINYTADNRLEITGKYNRPAIYTPTAVGAAGQSTGVATITPVGASIYQLLDIPLVTDVQAVSGFVAAMYGAKSGWQGGVLMQSTDAGANWAAIDDFGPPGATIGAATNTIGAVESRLIDKASQLTVVLANGELSSTTELAMLGGANHFAYGAHGRWEIIAAQTCALQSGSTYLLSNLLRGRFGTEQHMGAHVAGDVVVLLDADDASFIPMSTGSIGLARDYRGITLNRDISTDSNQSFTYTAANLKPLSPIALTGNRHPSTNDWTLTWLRRTRSGGEWRDYVDADLGETSEQYQVDIHADGSYTAVKRTLTVTAQGADYTSADQVTDFGSNQATLYVKIYQLSPTVGRGAPLTASITR